MKIQTLETTDPQHDKISKELIKLSDISLNLKRSVWKNNIMREARELFYYKDFIEKLDDNPNLLCFNNRVVDFKQKVFRKGQHDDYISKCTKIDYVPFDEKKMAKTFEEIALFIQGTIESHERSGELQTAHFNKGKLALL